MTISLVVRNVENLLQHDNDLPKKVEIMEMNLREKN
jgi:hypothetical protein